MSFKWNNTTEEVKYKLTGTENPIHLTEREKVMIEKFVKILDAERAKGGNLPISVKDHLKFAKFDYESEFNANVKLGNVVIRTTNFEGETTNEIGVVLQTFAGNEEFRTDMYGNTYLTPCKDATEGNSRFATLAEIKRYRPSILEDLNL